MALNLENCQENPNRYSNMNGDALKSASIGIDSNALKSASIGIDSEPFNGSTSISLSRKRSLFSCYQVKFESPEVEVINLEDDSDEEKPDLELSLKTHQQSICIKQEHQNESCECQPVTPNLNDRIQEPKSENKEGELILLGCVHCYLYVMVSKENPVCPMCRRNKHFIEIPSGKPFKRAKMD